MCVDITILQSLQKRLTNIEITYVEIKASVASLHMEISKPQHGGILRVTAIRRTIDDGHNALNDREHASMDKKVIEPSESQQKVGADKGKEVIEPFDSH